MARPVDTSDPLDMIEILQGTAASLIHCGGYDDRSASYNASASWIHERGHRIVGPHREIYLHSPADTAAEDLLPEILFPIDAEEPA